MTILGLAESFKTKETARPDRKHSLTVYLSENMKDKDVKF